MEYFAIDLYDVTDSAQLDASAIAACLHPSKLARQPLLRLQVLFRAAWHATLGCGASKCAFQAFVDQRRRASDLADMLRDAESEQPDERWTRVLSAAVQHAIRESCLAKLVDSDSDKNQGFVHRCLGVAMNDASPILRSASDRQQAQTQTIVMYLLEKWMDRFAARRLLPGTDEALQLSAVSLHNAYNIIVCEHSNLREALDVHPNPAPEFGRAVDEFYDHHRGTPKRYYQLCEEMLGSGCARRLNLGTGMTLTRDVVDLRRNFWTYNEAVRTIMINDVHYARTMMSSVLVAQFGASKNNDAKMLAVDAAAPCKDVSNCHRMYTANMPAFAAGSVRVWSVDADAALQRAASWHRLPCRDPDRDVDIVCWTGPASSEPGRSLDAIAPLLQRPVCHVELQSPLRRRVAVHAVVVQVDQVVLDQVVLDQVVLDQAVLDQGVLDQAVLGERRQWALDRTRLGLAAMDAHVTLRFNLPRLPPSERRRWPHELNRVIARRHATAPSKAASLGELAFLDFLSLYSHAALRPDTRLHVEPNARRAVVAIDTRPNVLTALSLLLALSNLTAGGWAAVLITREESRAFYSAALADHADGVHILCPAQLAVHTFDRDAYNAYLKSPELWISALGDYDEVLTVQDDGFLLRRGLEARFCGKYDYVGAPWAECDANRDLVHLANPALVGNGGLSLRNVAAMQKICVDDIRLGCTLFLNDTTPLPEDVFYSGRTHARRMRVCERATAALFSVEQVMCGASLGVHRFWAYHDPFQVINHLAPLLDQKT